MIFLCCECGNEFEGDDSTDICPICGVGKDCFTVQPYNIVNNIWDFPKIDDDE